MIDAYACNGDSGSGLFSDAGLVVGIVSYLTIPETQVAECRFTVAVSP